MNHPGSGATGVDAEYSVVDAEYSVVDAEYSVVDAEYSVVDAEYSVDVDAGYSVGCIAEHRLRSSEQISHCRTDNFPDTPIEIVDHSKGVM
jgi:hypothetical protein